MDVVCRLEVGNGGGTFLGEGNWQVYTEGNTVWFLEAYGVGTLYLPGRAPIELDLSAPDCGGTVAVEPAAATVVGQVTRLGEPEPDAVVRVCDLRVRVDAEGRLVEVQVVADSPRSEHCPTPLM